MCEYLSSLVRCVQTSAPVRAGPAVLSLSRLKSSLHVPGARPPSGVFTETVFPSRPIFSVPSHCPAQSGGFHPSDARPVPYLWPGCVFGAGSKNWSPHPSHPGLLLGYRLGVLRFCASHLGPWSTELTLVTTCVQILSSACGCPAVPAPSVGETVPAPGCRPCSLVGDQRLYVWGLFLGSLPCPSICLSGLSSVPLCLDDHNSTALCFSYPVALCKSVQHSF